MNRKLQILLDPVSISVKYLLKSSIAGLCGSNLGKPQNCFLWCYREPIEMTSQIRFIAIESLHSWLLELHSGISVLRVAQLSKAQEF